jgi:hypothetical protein
VRRENGHRVLNPARQKTGHTNRQKRREMKIRNDKKGLATHPEDGLEIAEWG